MEKQVIILGGGFSGLSLALRLSNLGIKVCLLESDNTIGGLAGTLRDDGHCMDIGPHSFFTEDNEILQMVITLFNNRLPSRPREVKFYYQGKYLDYPLTAYNVLVQMGIWSGIRTGLSFLKSKLIPKRRPSKEGQDETVEDWAISSFGEHLYRTFFKPYTEQFWKLPCSELSSRSIPTHTRMSFFNTLKLLVHKRIKSEDASLIEREMLPTYYPDSGFAEIAERIAEKATQAGARIHLNCEAVRVDELPHGRMRVCYDSNGKESEIEGSHVVSTIPLNQFVKMLSPPPPAFISSCADRLSYRSLTALGMVTEKQNILNCGYIYVLDRPYNRITEMNQFSPRTSPSDENIIMVEIPCLKNSSAWTASKEELFNMCIGSLAEDGFLAPGDVKRLLLIRAPNAYPIYRKDYTANLERVLDFINGKHGIFTLGRTGEFMYMDVDKCMRRAFDFADRILIPMLS
ncbi:MAG: FAD-dependent oxidoreductase [Deltaproteobacteria bacterium]|nr:FAD-dependent oxidoreductase [Deltaproteobacteria bacterium]